MRKFLTAVVMVAGALLALASVAPPGNGDGNDGADAGPAGHDGCSTAITIVNDYAESIFTVAWKPRNGVSPDAGPPESFSTVINQARIDEQQTFDDAIATDCQTPVSLSVATISIGRDHSFCVACGEPLLLDQASGEWVLVYEYDMALAQFAISWGYRAR